MIEQEITLLTNGRISFQKCGNGLQFGYSKNRGVYSIKVKTSGEWNSLTIRAFWHVPDGKDPASLSPLAATTQMRTDSSGFATRWTWKRGCGCREFTRLMLTVKTLSLNKLATTPILCQEDCQSPCMPMAKKHTQLVRLLAYHGFSIR